MENSARVRILCSDVTPRLRFIAGFLSSALRVTFSVVPPGDLSIIANNKGTPAIHYGNQPIPDTFNVFASGLLHEKTIRTIGTGVTNQGDHILLFPAPEGFDLTFDMFSAVFYLISRYEEYLPFEPDQYGRFEAGQSLAFRHHFLEEPIVDQWIEMFKSVLTGKYPELHFPAREFRFISTFDVDRPWAYLHKDIWRTFGGLVRDVVRLNVNGLRIRLRVLRGSIPDPYDTYAYIRQIELRYGFRSIFFFLSGNYGRFDDNYSLGNRHFSMLLDNLKSERTIGIHPSFASNFKAGLKKHEFARFSGLLGKRPEISRQHFLMLIFPYTYRELIEQGIREDFSMGYASRAGFRAGTCTPFRYYDLPREQETDLMVYPFAFMDVTLQQYLSLSPEEALDHVKDIIDKIKKVHGTCVSLWHNESLSEQGRWKGWRRVFEEMVKRVTSDE